MTPSQELRLIEEESKRILATEVVTLFGDFQRQSPVAEGSFRASWRLEKNADGGFTIRNSMGYATILFEGRRLVAGKWQGSEQWPEGGLVMLERFNRVLEAKFKGIRYGK